MLENILYNLKVLRYQLSGAYISSLNGVYDLYVNVKCMFLIQIWIQIDIKSVLEVLEAILSLVQSKQSGPWEMFKSQINSIQIEWSLKYKQSFYPRFWTPTSRNKLDAN